MTSNTNIPTVPPAVLRTVALLPPEATRSSRQIGEYIHKATG